MLIIFKKKGEFAPKHTSVLANHQRKNLNITNLN